MISGNQRIVQEDAPPRVDAFTGAPDANPVNDLYALCLVLFIHPFYITIPHNFDLSIYDRQDFAIVIVGIRTQPQCQLTPALPEEQLSEMWLLRYVRPHP